MKNEESSEPEIAVTGTAWMGSGVGSVQTAIEGLLQDAQEEVQLVVYEMSSGAETFLGELKNCLARGIRVSVVLNRYREKPELVRQILEQMVSRFPYFRIFDFRPANVSEDLHAKVLVVDRRRALVGSANLTWKGLAGNHELAVVVTGRQASTIASLVDKLCRDSRTVELTKR